MNEISQDLSLRWGLDGHHILRSLPGMGLFFMIKGQCHNGTTCHSVIMVQRYEHQHSIHCSQKWKQMESSRKYRTMNKCKTGNGACVSKLMEGYGNRTHFTNGSWTKTLNVINIFVFLIMFNNLMKSQICIHHENWIVIACAKLGLDMGIIFHIRAIHFGEFWIMSPETLCEMGPSSLFSYS